MDTVKLIFESLAAICHYNYIGYSKVLFALENFVENESYLEEVTITLSECGKFKKFIRIIDKLFHEHYKDQLINKHIFSVIVIFINKNFK